MELIQTFNFLSAKGDTTWLKRTFRLLILSPIFAVNLSRLTKKGKILGSFHIPVDSFNESPGGGQYLRHLGRQPCLNGEGIVISDRDP
jgi:hypothetical protein